jgi:hypothetical protein
MIEQADFYVRNNLTNGSINVARKLSNSSTEYETTIAVGTEKRILLQSTDVYMVISAPIQVQDLKTCPIKVRAGVDLSLLVSRTDRCWTLQILPNNLDPEAPTTVNVSVGPNET